MEEWHEVPGTNGLYSVSSHGMVRGHGGRILKPWMNSKGYLQFTICLGDGKQRAVRLHGMVALCFMGICPDGYQINHKNGIKTDNRVENLEYVTGIDNIRHGWRTGLYKVLVGEDASQSKLTEESIREIRRLSGTLPQRAIAKRYSVSHSTIADIVSGRTWGHVG